MTVTKKVFPRFLNREKQKFTTAKNMVSPLWFYSDKKGASTVFQGWQKTVFQREKEGFSTVVFFFLQVFQWCLNGEKQNVSTRKKEVCPQWFYIHKKRCFNGV